MTLSGLILLPMTALSDWIMRKKAAKRNQSGFGEDGKDFCTTRNRSEMLLLFTPNRIETDAFVCQKISELIEKFAFRRRLFLPLIS